MQIVNFAFNGASTSVKVGDTVSWKNDEAGVPHTTTANGGLWNSGSLSTGGVFQVTFSQAGTFTYRCTIHPSMTGTITVTG